jgi:hypothetical protein
MRDLTCDICVPPELLVSARLQSGVLSGYAHQGTFR